MLFCVLCFTCLACFVLGGATDQVAVGEEGFASRVAGEKGDTKSGNGTEFKDIMMDARLVLEAREEEPRGQQIMFSTFLGDVPLVESVDAFCALHSVREDQCTFFLNRMMEIMENIAREEGLPAPESPQSHSPIVPTFDASVATRLPRVMINLVSFPRSGHHMLKDVLESIFHASHQHWHYCENYQKRHACHDGHNVRKSHDFDVNLYPTPGEAYIVLVRRNRLQQLEAYYRFNCKMVAGTAHSEPCSMSVREFFDANRIYYNIFYNKWYKLAEQFPEQVYFTFYEDILDRPLGSVQHILKFLTKFSGHEASTLHDVSKIWDIRAAARVVREANITARMTEEMWETRKLELGSRYIAERGIRMFWDHPDSPYNEAKYLDNYFEFDRWTYFHDSPEGIVARIMRNLEKDSPLQ